MDQEIKKQTILPLNMLESIEWFDMIITGIIWFYIFLRILSIVRVSRDINARSNSTIMQLIAILLVTTLSPIVWIPLYITMRPVQYKKRN
jgi:hypothetical protein